MSWASLNNFMNLEQRSKIIELVANQQIKILYIQPELFSSEFYIYFPAVSLLVFEDAENILDYSVQFKTAGFHNNKIIQRLDPTNILLLTNLVPIYKINDIIKSVENFQQIENSANTN